MLVAALLASAPAALPFAPVAGARYRLTIVTERSDDGVTRRFSASREIVFARDGKGWTMTMTRVGATASPESGGAMFTRAEQALAGTSVRYRLDAGGQVRGIDDEAATLERFAAAVDAMGGKRRAPTARRIGDGLRALSPAERHAFLAEDAELVLSSAVSLGRRSVQVPGRGGAPALAGTREATLAGGRLTIRTDLRGEGNVREELRVVDAATGLLLSRRERIERRVGTATLIEVHTSTLTAPAS